MTTLVVGADSGIGAELFKLIPNCLGTSRRIGTTHIYLDLLDRLTWRQISDIDNVYFCIGVGGRNVDPLTVVDINGIKSYDYLKYLAGFVLPGARINVLSSIAGSLKTNIDTHIASNIYYKMGKSALNMGVIQLHQEYSHLNWTIIHPGFVNTKMTHGMNAQMQPEESARKILLLPKLNGLNFLHINGNRIDW